jgi:Ribbon-helix-helix domain
MSTFVSRKKLSTTIYVTPEQNDRLKLLHERTKVPVAVYIREGIDLVLRQYAHLLPGQLPLAEGPVEPARLAAGLPEAPAPSPPSSGGGSPPPAIRASASEHGKK